MTEKRFMICIDDENNAIILDKNVNVGQYNLCNTLNELNDENKELKTKLSEFDFLKNENKHMRTVINENMQLKKLLRKISNCNGEIWLSNGRIIRLKKIFNGEWIND